jgi:cardiolipin synthase A/B
MPMVLETRWSRPLSEACRCSSSSPARNNDKEVAQLATERYYRRLLDAGVEIHVFTPTMLHAKVMTVDSSVAVVGSANLNHRSLQHDEEVDVVLFDADIVAELDEHTDADLARCERVTPEDLDAVARAARAPLRVLTGLVARWT